LKNGKQIPTAKILGRLERAERAAGIVFGGGGEANPAAGNDVRSAEVKDSGPEDEGKSAAWAEHFGEVTKMVETLREQVVEQAATLRALVGVVADQAATIRRLAERGKTDETDGTDKAVTW
jgi:hypothetical protein